MRHLAKVASVRQIGLRKLSCAAHLSIRRFEKRVCVQTPGHISSGANPPTRHRHSAISRREIVAIELEQLTIGQGQSVWSQLTQRGYSAQELAADGEIFAYIAFANGLGKESLPGFGSIPVGTTLSVPKHKSKQEVIAYVRANFPRFAAGGFFRAVEHDRRGVGAHASGRVDRRPKNAAPTKLVVLVPYRNRARNLERFVPHLHSHLGELHHEIVVIEQAGNALFNKGRLFNAGFHLTQEQDAYFCFHDVDLLPEDTSCDYSYSTRPVHVSRYCSQFNYRVPYEWLCGGVMIFDKSVFARINGYSNDYWGWGAEDDDLYFRLTRAGHRVEHRHGRYTSLPHPSAVSPPLFSINKKRLHSAYDYGSDGLSSLRYTVQGVFQEAGYVRYLIDVGVPPSRRDPATLPSAFVLQPAGGDGRTRLRTAPKHHVAMIRRSRGSRF
jgi:hypothetical protein